MIDVTVPPDLEFDVIESKDGRFMTVFVRRRVAGVQEVGRPLRESGPPVCRKCKMTNEYAEQKADYVCYECRR